MTRQRNSSPSKPVTVWHVTSVKLSPAEHETLKRLAAAERRSLSAQIRHLIAMRAEELPSERTAA